MDVFMQTGHQSAAGRLVEYYEAERSGGGFGLFPPDFAEEAVEVGPRSDHEGPCLVMFRGVKMAPAQLNAWFLASIFQRFAFRIYNMDPAIPPCDSLEEVAAALRAAGLPAGPVRLQCHPRPLEHELALILESQVQLDPRAFEHVIKVIRLEGRLRWSCAPLAEFYKMTPHETPQFKGSVATAVNKLHEALTLIKARLGPLNVALDLGAAPGAWSCYLADHVRTVVAVDPAQLSAFALRPNVHHLKMRAEEAAPRIRELIGEGAGADLLVCDMNLHPAETSEIIKSLLPMLRPGGILVYTLKFSGISRNRAKSVAKLAETFEAFLEAGQLVWLMANTVNERTYIARRKQ